MKPDRRSAALFAILLAVSALVLILSMGIVVAGDKKTECTEEDFYDYLCEEVACLMSWLVTFAEAAQEYEASMTVTHSNPCQSYETGTNATVSVHASATTITSSIPDTVSLSLTLPGDVSGVNFPDDPPTSQMGNTYVWQNVPVTQDGGVSTTVSRTIQFNVGEKQGKKQLVAGLQWVHPIEGNISLAWGSDYYVTQQTMTGTEVQVGDAQSVAGAQSLEPSADTRDLVLLELWNTPDPDMALDEALWQDMLDSLGEATPFVGIAFPLEEDPDTNSYAWPVQAGAYAPVLDIVQYVGWEQHVVFSQTLTTLPEYVSPLMSAYGDQTAPIIAIGLDPDADLSPPPGLDLPAGAWELRLRVWLDLDRTQAELLDETIWLYGGFEGTGVAGASVSSLARTLMRLTGSGLAYSPNQARLYQGEGLTIIGPVAMRLRSAYSSAGTPNPPLQIRHTANAPLDPGETYTATHSLHNLTQSPIDVTVSVETSSGAQVSLYAGTYEGPTMPLEPFASTLTLGPGETRYLSLVGQAPGFPGLESVRIIGAVDGYSHTDERTNMFWIGGWSPPPEVVDLWRVVLPVISQ